MRKTAFVVSLFIGLSAVVVLVMMTCYYQNIHGRPNIIITTNTLYVLWNVVSATAESTMTDTVI